MADSRQLAADLASDLSMGTSHLPGREVLDRSALRALTVRSDLKGLAHWAGHCLGLLGTGLLVGATRDTPVLVIPAMILHGFLIATLFAPMHECVHSTAFRSRWLNRIIGWLAGAATFTNSDWYRYFHSWHQRYTQDPARDPELQRPKPRTLGEYWLRISGLLYWLDRGRELLLVTAGRTAHLPFVPDHARGRLVRSMRAHVALYGLVAMGAIGLQSTAPLVYWLLPELLGQPWLRAILLAEHTGCREDSNGLTNTRTTLTLWLVRFCMWNMPYHAEHHLYPAIPFHALPRVHTQIRACLAHLDNGYVRVNQTIVHHLHHSAPAAG
jgi:fatty acid desaturase